MSRSLSRPTPAARAASSFDQAATSEACSTCLQGSSSSGDEASRGTANGGTLVTGVNQQVKAGARLSGLKFSTPNTALSFAVTLQGGAVTSSTFEGGAGVLVAGGGTVGAHIQNNVFATLYQGVEGCQPDATR
ncbi:MAG: hypothetical protein IPG50_14035 [Myxococcales bacterium]|nr:hypothetical protein [Myxococcales bacterium]